MLFSNIYDIATRQEYIISEVAQEFNKVNCANRWMIERSFKFYNGQDMTIRIRVIAPEKVKQARLAEWLHFTSMALNF